MKRLFTLLLAVLYTFSSVGATVSTHYCMGKVMKCQCPKPKKNQKDHCCKDTVQYVKSQDVHAAKWVSEQKKHVPELKIESNYAVNHRTVSLNTFNKYQNAIDHSWSPSPLYQLHCHYRI